MAKIDTLLMTKTGGKPYPLVPAHTYIAHNYKGVSPRDQLYQTQRLGNHSCMTICHTTFNAVYFYDDLLTAISTGNLEIILRRDTLFVCNYAKI